MSKNYTQLGKQNNCLINNQVTCPFFISNEFIDFSESVWIFVFQNTVFEKKNWGFKRATVSSITRKILEISVMESWYKNISKIRIVTFFFQNFLKKIQKRWKNRKNWNGF